MKEQSQQIVPAPGWSETVEYTRKIKDIITSSS
jgi:hypothetical protein